MQERKRHKTVVYDSYKMGLTKFNLFLQQLIKVRFDIFKNHAHLSPLWIIILYYIDELWHEFVGLKDMLLNLTEPFANLNFSDEFDYLILCNYWRIHHF